MRYLPAALASATLALCSPWAEADTGKLLLTGGVSSIDGAAGGGLTPWAVIGSNATAREIGASAAVTRVTTQDYGLSVAGVAVGLYDRLELSAAKQDFNAGPTAALAGFGVTPGQHIKMDVFGAKLRVAGDAVLDSDTWLPQIAVGLEHKRVHAGSMGPVLTALGAKDRGTDVYVNATKLFLAQSLLVNGTVRWTNANQTGLLGYGGDRNDDLEPQFEGSVGYLLSPRLVVGAEYRTKPDNLGFAKEDDWYDIYAAYALNKHVSVTAAYTDLGSIATFEDQRGLYLSLQVGF